MLMLGKQMNYSNSRRVQRGLSIVEMMVGIAIGLIIVAAASLMVAGQLADNRRLMLETQIQQDLRAAADLISRDLRRAGYWKDAHLGTAEASAAGVGRDNPYAGMELPTSAEPLRPVRFTYADRNAVDNQAVDANEHRGFRVSNGTIQAALGMLPSSGALNWQPVTDPAVMTVADAGGLVIEPRVECVALRCEAGNADCRNRARPGTNVLTCTAGDAPCPAYQQLRNISVTITGTAAHDSSVVRTIRTQVRVRNDAVGDTCVEQMP
jgi:prepilin peptidase dependent protein B